MRGKGFRTVWVAEGAEVVRRNGGIQFINLGSVMSGLSVFQLVNLCSLMPGLSVF